MDDATLFGGRIVPVSVQIPLMILGMNGGVTLICEKESYFSH